MVRARTYWKETSQPWAGPCEGKRIELKQLLESLCIDVKAAVQADRPAHSLSACSDVEDRLLQSPPPSQYYLNPRDAALLQHSQRLMM